MGRSKIIEGTNIIFMGSSPKKKRKKKHPTNLSQVLDVVPEKPRKKRKIKKYGRREIAAMVIDDQITMFEELSDKLLNAPPMGVNARTGMFNALLKYGDSIWAKLGLDAAMVSEEAVQSALEIVGEIFGEGMYICSKCGHEDKWKAK